jgi:hypothetical protein
MPAVGIMLTASLRVETKEATIPVVWAIHFELDLFVDD